LLFALIKYLLSLTNWNNYLTGIVILSSIFFLYAKKPFLVFEKFVCIASLETAEEESYLNTILKTKKGFSSYSGIENPFFVIVVIKL